MLESNMPEGVQGGDAIFSGYLLMKTLAGDWSKIHTIVIVPLTSKQADFDIKSCLSGLCKLRSVDAHVKNKKEVPTGKGLSPSNCAHLDSATTTVRNRVSRSADLQPGRNWHPASAGPNWSSALRWWCSGAAPQTFISR